MHTSVPSKNGLVSPGDNNKREEARAIRVAGHGGADRACAPRAPVLTVGESPKNKSIVDWCSATWKPEPGEILSLNIHSLLVRAMGDVFGIEVPGILGYETGIKFSKLSYGSLVQVGRLDYGGDRHQGRARLDISGTGCAQIKNWTVIQSAFTEFEELRLTRVDLALDFIDGAYGVEDAKDWYLSGEFNAGGRNPRHSTPGDWHNPAYSTGEGIRYGRTLEVGRRENGKMLRSYEKGRQLGSSDSPWTRFEVELRNIDRDLPLDILTQTDKYFKGAYACLERLIESEATGQTIATHQKEGEISLERLTHHARVSYGKLVQVLRGSFSAQEIIDEIAREGVPRRLQKSTLSGFIAPPPEEHHKGVIHHE